VVVKVGDTGSAGMVEISDMLFSTIGPGNSTLFFCGNFLRWPYDSGGRNCRAVERETICTRKCWNVGYSYQVCTDYSLFLTYLIVFPDWVVVSTLFAQ
jgi:hypothetical protein